MIFFFNIEGVLGGKERKGDIHGLATGSGPARTVDRHHTTVVM